MQATTKWFPRLLHLRQARNAIRVIRAAIRSPKLDNMSKSNSLSIRNSGIAWRRQFGSRRSGWGRSHGTNQDGRRLRRWGRSVQRRRGRCIRWRRRQTRQPHWQAFTVRRHRQEHMVRESGLVSARTTDVHPATLAAGHRGTVRQGHRRVAPVPADNQRVGSRSILEAPRQQRGFFIPSIESVSVNRSVGCRIDNPRHEPRTIGTRGRISTHNIGRPRDLINQRHQRSKDNHGHGH